MYKEPFAENKDPCILAIAKQAIFQAKDYEQLLHNS